MSRLFILGAGASYSAGLPDGGTLAAHLFGFAGGTYWEVVRNKLPADYWRPLLVALDGVFRELPKLSDDGSQSRWALDEIFERFHQLMRRDPEAFGTAYYQLFEGTAQLLYSRSWTAATSTAYRRFVEALGPGDVVLTFNWDVCPELALYAAGRDFSRAYDVRSTELPWLLKLHGSVDYLIVAAGGPRPEIFEPLGVAPLSPIPGLEYELVRLQTYDFDGDIAVGDTSGGDFAYGAANSDVGPFVLLHTLRETPTYHLLAPGSWQPLYDWQYRIIEEALTTRAPSFERIYVAGYSFPTYDTRVFAVLRKIHERAGYPPTVIVNPTAAEPPDGLFSGCSLQACGFQEFDWSGA